MRWFIQLSLVGVAIVAGCASTPHSPKLDPKIYAAEKDLLATNQVTATKDPTLGAPDMASAYLALSQSYLLAYEESPVYFAGKEIRIRVWAHAAQGQIIQVLDKNGVVISARKVVGSPWMQGMQDAWSTHDGGEHLFVYIKGRLRWRTSPAVYIYQIDRDFLIQESGVFFDKHDLQEEEAFLREMKRQLDKTRDADAEKKRLEQILRELEKDHEPAPNQPASGDGK